MPMNPSQVLVVNPVLTTIAHGYSNEAYVGQYLFPRVGVGPSQGTVLKFNRDRFRKINTKRARTADVPTVRTEYGSTEYSLDKHDLDGVVAFEDMEDASESPGIDLATLAIEEARDMLDFSLEIEQSELARNAALYSASNKETLAAGTRWTQTTGTPLEDIRDAREAIRSKIGKYPNVLVLSAKAHTALEFHASLIDRIKFSTGGVVDTQLIAALTRVPNVYTAADQITNDAGTAVSDLWGADAILAYVPQAPGGAAGDAKRNKARPSYGYTYQKNGYPRAYSPFVVMEKRLWRYPNSDWRKPLLTAMDAGFLFINAGDNS